jgi:hypothetical protein
VCASGAHSREEGDYGHDEVRRLLHKRGRYLIADSTLHPYPREHTLQGGIFVKPVASSLICTVKITDDVVVGDLGKFLRPSSANTMEKSSVCKPPVRDITHVSKPLIHSPECIGMLRAWRFASKDLLS